MAIFKKLLTLLVSLWCLITVTFFLMHMVPGDPFIGDKALPEEVLRSLHRYYGLDQPLGLQYLKYLQGVLHFDFGLSLSYQGRPVIQFILDGWPVSFLLGVQALVLAIPSGILLGTWAALKRAKWQDHAAMFLATLLISLPNFVLASLLQYIFAVKLNWAPVARWGTLEHMVLPILTLAAMPIAYIARLTRSTMVEILGQDYVRAALAKGLSPFRVAIRHGLRNAILPVIAYLGPVITSILTGSFMVEKMFSIPGLGKWMIISIGGRDYPMIMGLAIFFCICLCLSLFLVDLIYALLDPRITLFKQKQHE